VKYPGNDHVGSLAAIKNMCGCPAAVHETERELLEAGSHPLPPGTNPLGRVLSFLGRSLGSGMTSFDPVRAEVTIGDEYPLRDLGLEGKIIATPGHTRGSVSVVLDSGQAMVGDAAFNLPPLTLGSVKPAFGEDLEQIMASWQKLIQAGAREIYPAHGRPFSVQRLEKALNRCSKGTI
jgi:glyoxylase-like metal-dependent hydrolase (beta-lactamase superfamily II)